MEWIRHGWGKEYSTCPDEHRQYYIDISDIKFTSGESLYHAKFAIEQIKKRYPPPYYLAASGGIDSQAMIWAWYTNNEDFKVVSFRYDGGLNDHDIQNLKLFCDFYKISYQFIESSFLTSFDNDLTEWSLKYNCESPQMFVYSKFRDLITDGTVILSGELYPSVGLSYTSLGLERYRLDTNSNFVPFFFMTTPHLLGSFYYDYQIVNEIYKFNKDDMPLWDGAEREHMKKNIYKIKSRTYWLSGYPVIPQKTKYSGFEGYKDYFDKVLKVSIKDKAKYLNYTTYPSQRMFDIYYRYRLADNLTLPKRIVVVKKEQ